MNSDVAFDKVTGVGWVAIICRAYKGSVLTTLAHRIFANSPLVAEALGLREAASLASKLHVDSIILESDNLSLVESCNGFKHNKEIKFLIEDINKLRSNILRNEVTWVSRDGNKVAHEVALLASLDHLGVNWCSCPLNSLRSAIVEDCMCLWS